MTPPAAPYRKVLFVIHGMGANAAGWSGEVTARLDTIARGYAKLKDGPAFSERVHVEELTYDEVFDAQVDDWNATRAALEGAATEEGLRLPRVLNFLNTSLLPPAEKNFFWTTLIDPLLYRGFRQIRDEVRARLVARLEERLDVYLDEFGKVEASILAHSLGTIVTHDTLALMGAGTLGSGSWAFTARGFMFDNLFLLANLARLGPNDIDPYTSCVRPESAGAVEATGGAAGAAPYCRRLFSFQHRWDPFTWWETFRPPTDWGDGYLCPPALEHVHQANVHGFQHYLDHPAVHVPILKRMLGVELIPKKEELEAIARFPLIKPTSCAVQIDALKTRCEELKGAVTDPRDLDEVTEAGIAFFLAARRAAADCVGLAGELGGIA